MGENPERVDRDVLLAQYQASLKQDNRLAVRLEQAAVRGMLFLSLVTAFVFLGAGTSLAIAWVAPLLYLVVFGALMSLGARQAAAAWQSRILARQLQGSREAPHYDGVESAGGAIPDPFSPWRLSWKLGLLPGAAAVIFGGLFLPVTFYCWRSIYAYNHLMGLAHAGFYLALALLELMAAAGLSFDLPRRYAAARESGLLAGLELSPARPLQTIGRWVVPFPRHFTGRSRIFWAGFLAPLLIIGLNQSRLEILNALFRSFQDWETTASVPLLATAALGLLVFIAAEILLQQAAAIWTAWRAGQAGDVPFPVPQIILRWLAALLLGYLIDRRGLLLLLVIISVYELGHILWPQDPRHPAERGRYPLLLLLVEAGGLPLCFVAGLLVWGGPVWDFTVYLAMGVMVYFLSLGLSAAARQKDARSLQEQGSSFPGSTGTTVNDYFLERGVYWRAVGLWSALLSGVLLLAMQTLTENCSIKPRSPFSSFYAFCPVKDVPPVYVQIDKLNSLLVAFDMLVLILIVMMLLVQLLGPGLDRLTASARPFNPLIAQVYFLVALVVVAIGFQHASAAWVAGGTTVAMMGLIVKRDP